MLFNEVMNFNAIFKNNNNNKTNTNGVHVCKLNNIKTAWNILQTNLKKLNKHKRFTGFNMNEVGKAISVNPFIWIF